MRGELLESVGRVDGEVEAVRVVTMEEYWNCEDEEDESVNFDPFHGQVPRWNLLHLLNKKRQVTCRNERTSTHLGVHVRRKKNCCSNCSK